MLFAQAEPMARKDRGSNYILVQWIKEAIMGGLLGKLDKNTRFFAGTRILLSLSMARKYKSIPTDLFTLLTTLPLQQQSQFHIYMLQLPLARTNLFYTPQNLKNPIWKKGLPYT